MDTEGREEKTGGGEKKRGGERQGYLLDAELADGVVHQHHHVLHRDPDVAVGPAALVWPVLGTLTLRHTERLPLYGFLSNEKKQTLIVVHSYAFSHCKLDMLNIPNHRHIANTMKDLVEVCSEGWNITQQFQ